MVDRLVDDPLDRRHVEDLHAPEPAPLEGPKRDALGLLLERAADDVIGARGGRRVEPRRVAGAVGAVPVSVPVLAGEQSTPPGATGNVHFLRARVESQPESRCASAT
jgi:hypothetical protein